MPSPLFTIVIPYFNRAQFLPATLNSLRQLTYRPLRVFLVDNHSTDTSPALCRQFAEQHSAPDFDIHLLEEKKPGAAAARNAGLAQVETPYVYFFDSDDLLSPTFFDDVAAILSAQPSSEEVDIITLTTRMTFPNGQSVIRRPRPSASAVQQVLTGMLSTQSVVWRTAFLREIGGWNESVLVWNDWELGLRALLATPRMLILPQEGYHEIQQHAQSITGETFSSRLTQILHSINQAERAAQSHPTVLKALDGRRLILAGHIHHEGNPQEAAQLRAQVLSRRTSWRWHLFALYCFRIRKAAWQIYPLLFP